MLGSFARAIEIETSWPWKVQAHRKSSRGSCSGPLAAFSETRKLTTKLRLPLSSDVPGKPLQDFRPRHAYKTVQTTIARNLGNMRFLKREISGYLAQRLSYTPSQRGRLRDARLASTIASALAVILNMSDEISSSTGQTLQGLRTVNGELSLAVCFV